MLQAFRFFFFIYIYVCAAYVAGISTQRLREVNGIMGASIVQYSTLIIPEHETGEDTSYSKRTHSIVREHIL